MNVTTDVFGFKRVAIGLLAITGIVSQAQAAIFSFGAAETSPTQHMDFDRVGDTGSLTSATTVEFQINIGGTAVEIADVDFVLDATIDSVVDVGILEQIIFSGTMSFTDSGGDLIISATFTGGSMYLNATGRPVSGLRAEDDAVTVIDEVDYVVGPTFEAIAGPIVGFDPDDPLVIVDLIAPEDLEFTLTHVEFDADGFTANGSYSGNAELSVIIVPEPGTGAMVLAISTIAIVAGKRRVHIVG